MQRRLSKVVLLDLVGLAVFFSLAVIVCYQCLRARGHELTSLSQTNYLSVSDLHQEKPRSVAIAVSLDKTSNNHCTMGACFDVSRCGTFKVFVYPEVKGEHSGHSPLYQKILSIIRNSRYYTSDPTEACLFIPSYDTLDRDTHSKDYLDTLPSLASLEHWNGGRNHLIFNQYAGTWPDYNDQLDFDTGQAIVAKASFNMSYFRRGFDVSLPLLHNEHPEWVGQSGALHGNAGLFPIRRKYLLAFKGKRYLYGTGRETRASLYHLHNDRDILMLTTCKHNQDWAKHQDKRCHADNELYDKYDYADLLANSSYCLVPRGRRLGSFRFLEALQASCVPVSLSNGYVLPFDEVIDWTQASLELDERRLLQVSGIVRSIPTHRLLSLRLHTQLIWDTYFKSVEKVVMTTLEILQNRLIPRPRFVWNQSPGGLVYHPAYNLRPHTFPFYHTHSPRDKFTVIITCTHPATRESAPLISLIKALSTSAHLEEVIVQWVGVGPPRVDIRPLGVPVRVVRSEGRGLVDQFWPLDSVKTDAVLHLTEEAEINSDEVEFGFAVWQSFRDRLIGYVAHNHYWDDVREQWGYSDQPSNEFSLVLSRMLFFHKYYGYLLHEMLSPRLVELANQNTNCLDIVLNFLVADVTGKRPIKVSHRTAFTKTSQAVSTATLQRTNQERVACLNMAANVYGRMPLLPSMVRADPVLYRDNVSMLRKEFKQMELN